MRFAFTAPMPGGPWVKWFDDVRLFEAYVINWRDEFGAVDWLTPFLAKGAL